MLARIALQPGVVKDETEIAARPRWIDADKVRFYRGLPQPIGGHELATPDEFTGKCRGLYAWNANDGRAFGAVGTHSKLYAFYGGRLYDITPIRSSATLGTDPIATTDGESDATITHTSHGAATGATVYIHNPDGAINGVTVGGAADTLTDPFTTTSGSTLVQVTDAGHGLATGDIVNVASASAVGGVTPNGDYTIYVLDADNYQIEHSSAATSTATGGGSPDVKYYTAHSVTYVDANSYTVPGSGTASSTGSGGGTTVEVKYEINPGLEDGRGAGGYGLGGYGAGGYGTGDTSSVSYPRTWSMDNWGEYLVASPRGGTIYEWTLSTSQRAAAISNCPSTCNGIFVTPQRHLVAVGAHNGSSDQPLRVAWSDQDDNTVWTASETNQAGSYPLNQGSRCVAGKASTSQNIIWTDTGLFRMIFNSDPQLVFSFEYIGDGGLIGPNAAIEKDGRAFWVGVDQQFYVYDGGVPRALDCPVRRFVFNDLSPAQEDKIFVGSNAEFSEAWVFYPAGSANLECSRYVTWDWINGPWSIGTFERTAWVDRSGLGGPLAAGSDGLLYFHEVGTGAVGAGFDAFIESSQFELGEGSPLMDIFQYIPDFDELSVGVYLTLTTRIYPQAETSTDGPFLITAATETVDMRVSGRQATVKFSSVPDSQTFWRLGDIRMDIQPAGNRR